MTEKFDYEQALADIKAGKPLTGKDSILSPLIKQLTEAALEAEIDTHLAKEVSANRKNGKSRKTIKSTMGEQRTPGSKRRHAQNRQVIGMEDTYTTGKWHALVSIY